MVALFAWLSGQDETTRTVNVNGGLSRVREDALIRETTGLVVSAALINNQDVTEAIKLNATTGTVASYRAFDRRCGKYSEIGYPVTGFTYSDIDIAEVELAIRTATGQAFPSGETAETDVSLGVLTGESHLKYHLQESYSYNLTTNIFTYLTKDYYYDSYVDIGAPHTGYTVNGYRTKEITTTTTSAITVYYDVGEAKWKHKDTVTTDVDYVYDPPGETGSSSSSVDNITDYNTGTNPYGLDLSDTGVTFNICILGGFESLCAPVIVETTENDPVSFTLNEARPSATQELLDKYSNPQTRTNHYWVVLYTHLGREYIWYGSYNDYSMFLEVTSDVSGNDYLRFAPVIPTRNNQVNYTSANTPLYQQANICLKQIGLSIDVINEQITDNKVEDAYVSMFSNVITTHQDQLAYNFAFFEYVASITPGLGGITESNYFTNLSTNTEIYNFNRLTLTYKDIYSNGISWNYITKTENVVGALTEDYEYSHTATTGVNWVHETAMSTYVIRKKTGANSYTEIVVYNYVMEFTVYASAGDVAVYTVDASTDSDQLIVPFSFKIASDLMPRQYFETLCLRCTYVGVFAKDVQETTTKWYQQGWFGTLLTIAAVALIIYTGQYQYLDAAITAISTTYAISYTLAAFVLVAKFAIISYALQAVLIQVFKSTDNQFIKILATVAYIYASVQLTGGTGSFNQMLTGGKAILDAVSIDNSMKLADLQKSFQSELEKFNLEQEKYEAISKDLATLAGDQAYGQFALKVSNLFKRSGEELVIDNELELEVFKPDYLINLTTNYVNNAKNNDIATLFIETEQLLS